MIEEGHTAKIADDLYAGANSVDEPLLVWEKILARFQENNLRLSSKKTTICPGTTNVLGWIWTRGTLSACPHKVNPLVNATPPLTVKGLRGWLGTYKYIRRCIPHHAPLLAGLEAVCAGKDSRDHVTWTEELQDQFKAAQEALRDLKTITVPRPTDRLVITTDGAVRDVGVGAALFVVRQGNKRLGGYFSAKLSVHQQRWLPCEVEALAIHLACEHWKKDILNSAHQTQILTDSKPCVQAYQKLTKGEFSASSRVSTFLSTLSRFQVSVTHIAGADNLPADFLSRNAVQCEHGSCQVCSYVADCATATVRAVTVADVAEGRVPVPFANPLAWKAAQQDCPVLRQTYTYLHRGTRPTRKMTRMTDVKRYLNVATINRDKVLVAKREEPFAPTRYLTIIPRHIVHGLVTALHIRLSHPTKHQLTQVFNRHFFALESEAAIAAVTRSCTHCAALQTLPREIQEFSTSPPPTVPGAKFACDVLKRAKQCIFVIRDCFTSFNMAQMISSEGKNVLRNAILETTALVKTLETATVRADGAPAFQSLVGDRSLARRGISVEVGRLKNPNKNPIADKAIRELEDELRRHDPNGQALTSTDLAIVVSTLNSRIRNRGLSAREILFQREGNTGKQLTFRDQELAESQYNTRRSNHDPSAKSKARGGNAPRAQPVSPGDLVHLKCDGDKHTARPTYLVLACGREFIEVQKLVGGGLRRRKYRVRYGEIYPVPIRREGEDRSITPVDSSASESETDDIGMLCHPSADYGPHSSREPTTPGGQDGLGSPSRTEEKTANLGKVADVRPDVPRSRAGRRLIRNPKYYSKDYTQ